MLDRLLDGKKESNFLTSLNANISLSNAKSATEDYEVCVLAPPKSSEETDSFVTVLTTSGPVTNI